MGCVSNSDYMSAARVQASAIRSQAVADAAIQIGLALWQRNTSRDIMNMQNEIADEQMKLAEATQAHAETFWPAEKALVDEAFNETKAVATYTALAGEWGGLTEHTMDAGREDWIGTMRRACMAPTRCEDARFQRSAQLARADAISFAARQEEARTQAINDRRYERRYSVLGMGRGRLATVKGFQQVSLQAGGGASGALFNTINGALGLYGYLPPKINSAQWGHASGIRSDVARETYVPQAPPTMLTVERPTTVPVPSAPPVRTHRDERIAPGDLGQ